LTSRAVRARARFTARAEATIPDLAARRFQRVYLEPLPFNADQRRSTPIKGARVLVRNSTPNIETDFLN